jgi:hypothetical protein
MNENSIDWRYLSHTQRMAMRLLFQVSVAVLLMLLQTPSFAEVTPPRGWESQRIDGGILSTSPSDAEGRQVKYLQLMPERAAGEVRMWFEGKMADVRQGMNAGALPPQGAKQEDWTSPDRRRQLTLYSDGFSVLANGGGTLTVVGYGYRVGDWNQLMILMLPSGMSERDGRLIAALEDIAYRWKSGALAPRQEGPAPTTQKPAAAPVSPAPAAKSGTSTKNCRKIPMTINVPYLERRCSGIGVTLNCQMVSTPRPITTEHTVCD